MKFKKVKLGELCDISSSKRIFAKEYVEEGIPFYRSKEIILKHNRKEIKEPLFISYDRYKEIKEKHGAPEEGDILLTSVGTLGVPYIVNSKERFYFKDGNLTWLKNFREVVNNKYIYYWLQSKYGKNEINKITIGSTQQAITINSLKNLEVQLPSLKIQNKITRILDAIYEKENNNFNIQNNLEELAQILFKRWFVDFEFPNEEGNPYKSSGGKMVESELGMIPEGWNLNKLNEISKLIMGLSPKSSTYNEEGEGLPLLNGAADFNGSSLAPKRYTSDPKRISIKSDLILCIRATIGNLTYSDSEYALGRGVAAIRPYKREYSELLYHFVLRSINRLKAQATGSVISGLSKPDLENIIILVPDDKKLNKFHNVFSSIQLKQQQLSEENIRLVNIRDTLLPKLLSGEVELPDDMEVTDDV
ncbi:restriction endonuclease subunit S [Nosocomiicoccus sp. HMSC059G07]|uniref:restriction endonuclease subunit S n=1 Tax=Nosocomiicoccus sp. HMSC059G07 TaxID=1739531 RepID=UPI0008A37469|nr:restriction endonuclease subunit S [Nosocomiicoccus sp. HMSC059G07]